MSLGRGFRILAMDTPITGSHRDLALQQAIARQAAMQQNIYPGYLYGRPQWEASPTKYIFKSENFCETCGAEWLNGAPKPKESLRLQAERMEREARLAKIAKLKRTVLFWLTLTVIGGAAWFTLGYTWCQR